MDLVDRLRFCIRSSVDPRDTRTAYRPPDGSYRLNDRPLRWKRSGGLPSRGNNLEPHGPNHSHGGPNTVTGLAIDGMWSSLKYLDWLIFCVISGGIVIWAISICLLEYMARRTQQVTNALRMPASCNQTSATDVTAPTTSTDFAVPLHRGIRREK